MSTHVYWMLGIPGSGRRRLLVDLIQTGFEAGERVGVLIDDAEPGAAATDALEELTGVGVVAYRTNPDKSLAVDLPEDPPETLFVLFNGARNPVDQVETWKAWMDPRRFQLARVITVVHCAFLSAKPETEPWFDACIHFSDVVLLNRREQADNSWVEAYRQRFKKRKLPCIVEYVKKDTVDNPAYILEPEARRMSLALEDWEETPESFEGIPIEIEGDADAIDDEDDPIPPDPYLERMPGGRRRKVIPNIIDFLP